jgi:endonuclease/exonuclease/phosphatase family metal-dependent hydrolase
MHDSSDDGMITGPDRGPSRRRLLGGLAGGTLAGLVGWQESTTAKKRRAKHQRSRRDRRQGRGGDPTRAEGEGNRGRNAAALKVLTRNIYLGADLAPTFGAPDLPSLVAAVSQVYAMVQATNFPERAAALADEIAAIDPHLVGLQEVTLWRSESPSNLSLTPNATTVEYDFLALLLDELAKRGKAYAAVATVQNFDAEAPRAITPTTLQDVRITDHDVILARTDLPQHVFSVGNAASANYAAKVLVPLLGAQIPVSRGWTSVDVRLHGNKIQVVNTHLEPVDQTIQQQQAAELLAVIERLNTGSPTVLLGDLNSAADDGATYRMLRDAAFVDAWSTAKPNDAGLTCCHAEDVRNPDPILTERIDFVLTRDGIAASSANRVGHEPEDRTPSGLWPSDHAGVWAVLHLQKA